MSKKTWISLTLSHSNQDDVEILQFLQRFGTGKGVQARSYEVKRILTRAVKTEAMQLPAVSIEKAPQQTTHLLAAPALNSSPAKPAAPGEPNSSAMEPEAGFDMNPENIRAQAKKLKASVAGVAGFEMFNQAIDQAQAKPAAKS